MDMEIIMLEEAGKRNWYCLSTRRTEGSTTTIALVMMRPVVLEMWPYGLTPMDTGALDLIKACKLC